MIPAIIKSKTMKPDANRARFYDETTGIVIASHTKTSNIGRIVE